MAQKANDLAAIRTEYQMGHLHENEVHADAIQQFRQWFAEAMEKQVMEPNAMSLATVSAEGRPSSRIVLLKQLDDRGFSFYTNMESQKGEELRQNPAAALLFFWPELQRQVRVCGNVERLPEEVADAYFRTRPKGSQLGAAASPQSREIASRKLLDEEVARLEDLYDRQEVIPRPAHWGGYRLVPDTVEFWQGRRSRLHDRLIYQKQSNGWRIVRLAP